MNSVKAYLNIHQRGYIKDEKYIKEKVHYYTTVSAIQKNSRHEY